MTREELIKNNQNSNKFYNKAAIVWFVFFFGVLIGNLPLSRHVDEASAGTRIVYGILFFGFLLVQIPLHFWFRKYILKRFHLICPHCNNYLDGYFAGLAIATGSCGHCGEKVVDEESTENMRVSN